MPAEVARHACRAGGGSRAARGLARTVRRHSRAADVAARPRPGRRRPAGAGPAHGRGGAARRGPGARAGLRRLPPRAEPRALVRPRARPAAPARCWSPPSCRTGRWWSARRHDRAALGPADRARGIYRDPVRSSRGHFVKASGLRWLSVMLLAPVPWAGRVWALPFLTVLAPSERYARGAGRAAQEADRLGPAGAAADRALAAGAAARRRGRQQLRGHGPARATSRRHLCVVTRLRLDARLFAPPPPRDAAHDRAPPVDGARLPTLAQRLADRAHALAPDHRRRLVRRRGPPVDIASGTALWHHPGMRSCRSAGCWCATRRARWSRRRSSAPTSTPSPSTILRWFVRRWATEITFEEARRHLGVETQRQWSDLAILRTTPALLGLFSLVTLWADEPAPQLRLLPRAAAWYAKRARHLQRRAGRGATRDLGRRGFARVRDRRRGRRKCRARCSTA